MGAERRGPHRVTLRETEAPEAGVTGNACRVLQTSTSQHVAVLIAKSDVRHAEEQQAAREAERLRLEQELLAEEDAEKDKAKKAEDKKRSRTRKREEEERAARKRELAAQVVDPLSINTSCMLVCMGV
jgi:glycine/D-amino acid oxidase-like deaminating enzyme